MADRNPASLTRGSLGWWLAAIQVLIVLVVAAGVSWAAVDLLERLADNQQRARVRLAGIDAKAELARASDDVLSFARVLSERPTLRRLLKEHDVAAMQPFVTQFCSTSGMDACAVLQNDQVLVSTGTVAWPRLLTTITAQGERFMVGPQELTSAWIGARIPLGEVAPGVTVVVAQSLGEGFAQKLAPQEDVSIRFLSYRDFNSLPVDDFTSLHTTALADGRYAVDHIPKLGIYAASHPVFSPTGEGILLIETRLSSKAVDDDVGALQRRLLWVAAILAALALLGGVLLGRRITVPTEALTAAAARLGQGDFATSIPKGGPAEIGQLAHTMDDMRRNLIALTDTLRQRESEAQAVLGGIVEGVYAVDGQRRITYINDTAARLLDMAPGDAVGRFCGDVLQPRRNADGALPCDVNCPILLARNAGPAMLVEQLRTRAGDRRMVLTSAAPVNNLQVQVLRDETELEAVRRARDTVLANVSHEFRTPLAAQLASIELLRDGLATRPPAQLEELVLSLERGTRRLTQLIDNLLESVRIEAGQLDIRRQSIDLADVIEDAMVTVEALLRQRGQVVTRNLGEDLAVQGDAVRLTQVFVNLLANASKFAPERTSIRIGAERDDKWITAWVEDAGLGLPEGAQESIFDRFSRGGTEPAPGGMGLGLSISRSIARRHGGTLDVSRTADKHTRFTLTLPVEPA